MPQPGFVGKTITQQHLQQADLMTLAGALRQKNRLLPVKKVSVMKNLKNRRGSKQTEKIVSNIFSFSPLSTTVTKYLIIKKIGNEWQL